MMAIRTKRESSEEEQRRARREARKRAAADASRQILIQAAGTLLGGGMLGALAVLFGVIQRTPANTILSISVALLGAALVAFAFVAAQRIGYRHGTTSYWQERDAEFMARFEAAAGDEPMGESH